MNRKAITTIIAVAMFLLAGAATAFATEIVWEPVNPSFVGGNPLNGAYLLGKAQAQDDNKDPSATSSELSRLDDFRETLNRNILSLLSSRIVEKAFGESTELPNGTFSVGDFKVTINDQITTLEVTVVDVPNNNTTTISIPTVQ
jgi:curli production assembly/transport component CsgF